jgi:hypothetical protein
VPIIIAFSSRQQAVTVFLSIVSFICPYGPIKPQKYIFDSNLDTLVFKNLIEIHGGGHDSIRCWKYIIIFMYIYNDRFVRNNIIDVLILRLSPDIVIAGAEDV